MKAIGRARATFVPQPEFHGYVDNKTIRTHSARHRMINDMKSTKVPKTVGMRYTRIFDQVIHDAYGALLDHQAGKILEGNRELNERLAKMYESLV